LKVTLESTDVFVEIAGITARVWEGHTESGIPVAAIIPRVACPADADVRQFEAELKECAPPRMLTVWLPLRITPFSAAASKETVQ
jgi:hypothetical protein